MTAETFEAYAAGRANARFTDWLRERSEPDWTAATEHRFVRELANGTVDDAVFRWYLVQDYAFVGTLTSAFGYAVGQAPTMEARGSLTKFLGTLTDEENDYFERSFDALGVPDDDRMSSPRADVTEVFEDLLVRASLEGGYEETLAVLVSAEWVYLTWASAVPDAPRSSTCASGSNSTTTPTSRRSSRGCDANSTSTGHASTSVDSAASNNSSAGPWPWRSRSSTRPTSESRRERGVDRAWLSTRMLFGGRDQFGREFRGLDRGRAEHVRDGLDTERTLMVHEP